MKNRISFLLKLFLLVPIFSFGSSNLNYDFTINIDSTSKFIFVELNIKLPNKSNAVDFKFCDFFIIKSITNNSILMKYEKANDSLLVKNNLPFENLKIEYIIPIDSFTITKGAIVLRREQKWYPILDDSFLFSYQLTFVDTTDYFIINGGENYIFENKINFKRNISTTIPLVLLKKSFFYKKAITNKIKKFIFYATNKIDTLNRTQFNNLFVDSYVFYANFFQYQPFSGEMEIIEIPDSNYTLIQALPNITIYGLPGLNYFCNYKYNWITHEIAHQWWGSSLFFDKNKKNYWFMSESINEYLKLFFVKEHFGDSAFREAIKENIEYFESYISPKTDIPISKVEKINSLSSLIIYQKGSLVVSSLSKMMGEKKFQEIIKNIYNTNRFSTIDFQYFNNILKQKLDKISLLHFNNLLNQKGLDSIKN